MAYIPDVAIDRMFGELSSGARDLYTFLCRCRNQTTGKCFPSVSTTQDALELSRARVFALRKELAGKGWAQFDGNYAVQLFGFGGLENKTIHELAEENSGKGNESLKNKTSGIENETAEIEESQKQDSASLKNQTNNSGIAEFIEFPAESLKNKTEELEIAPSLKNKTESLKNETKKSQKLDLHIGRTSKDNQQSRTSKDISASPNGAAGQLGNSHSNPEGGRSPTGKPKAIRKKPEKPKSEFHNHPAVVAYRETLGFFTLNASQADLIAQATGPEIELPPEDWLRFLRELAETGNKYAHNVRVMVWAYERYEIGACLSEALEAAWGREKGRPANNGNSIPHNRGKPTLEEKNRAAFDEAARRLGIAQDGVIDITGTRL